MATEGDAGQVRDVQAFHQPLEGEFVDGGSLELPRSPREALDVGDLLHRFLHRLVVLDFEGDQHPLPGFVSFAHRVGIRLVGPTEVVDEVPLEVQSAGFRAVGHLVQLAGHGPRPREHVDHLFDGVVGLLEIPAGRAKRGRLSRHPRGGASGALVERHEVHDTPVAGLGVEEGAAVAVEVSLGDIPRAPHRLDLVDADLLDDTHRHRGLERHVGVDREATLQHREGIDEPVHQRGLLAAVDFHAIDDVLVDLALGEGLVVRAIPAGEDRLEGVGVGGEEEDTIFLRPGRDQLDGAFRLGDLQTIGGGPLDLFFGAGDAEVIPPLIDPLEHLAERLFLSVVIDEQGGGELPGVGPEGDRQRDLTGGNVGQLFQRHAEGRTDLFALVVDLGLEVFEEWLHRRIFEHPGHGGLAELGPKVCETADRCQGDGVLGQPAGIGDTLGGLGNEGGEKSDRR